MLEAGRAGKLSGAGFYSYPEHDSLKGGKKHLWVGLSEKFENKDCVYTVEEIKDRLLYIQAIETVRCIDEQVLTSVRDANIGSIMGIGYPIWTGGILQFIYQTGLPDFIKRADGLAEQCGERFSVPERLRVMARDGLTFKD